ncbi:hypothetical protein ABER23_30545 [Paenibacillus lautus]
MYVSAAPQIEMLRGIVVPAWDGNDFLICIHVSASTEKAELFWRSEAVP